MRVTARSKLASSTRYLPPATIVSKLRSTGVSEPLLLLVEIEPQGAAEAEQALRRRYVQDGPNFAYAAVTFPAPPMLPSRAAA
jgi:hypothetical protein